MTGRSRLQVNEEEFKKMYDDGVPIIDIRKHFGISKSTTRNIRIKLKLPVRRWRVKFDVNEYMRLFQDETVSYPEMSKRLGISLWLVNKIRKRLNLSARKRGVKRTR